MRKVAIPFEPDVSTEELIKARGIAATIVKNYGPDYLPVFNRVHELIEEREKQQKEFNLALQYALPGP
ncbi:MULTISPECIES: hypothetical protein [unclassified Pseudovibrio]|uniref:hypothetical protein n=1 Tax=unclassified Pseudovibrio TaxID=2627060 RepID=UPI0007B18349|nr:MULTISPECIES: hypothetical protein [unclassified Pseudovibrio]KZL02303.1 hypothetical protein PsW74_01401 [Pseudovibrio sp. W74]KZL08153.1 hypothetical protein PsAD14_03300 [Pseudovibrio sp. Ad14]